MVYLLFNCHVILSTLFFILKIFIIIIIIIIKVKAYTLFRLKV